MMWRTLALALVGAASGTLGLWASDREPPVVRTANPVALEGVVPPGGSLGVRFSVFRKRSCAVKVERMLFDASDVRYPLEDLAFSGELAGLGNSVYTSKIAIPRSFSQGPARYRTVSTYTCNLVHRLWPIVMPASEVAFKVWGDPVPLELPIKITP